jgi:RHS repeat-associated protein
MANDCSDGASHHILTLTNTDGSPQSRTHNLQNQVIAVGGANLSFDANGNMTVDEQGRTFIWDAWNRLVEVNQGSTTLVEYQYDGLKRRIVEDDGTSERHLYYSDQWQVLEERVGGDTVTQYVWSAVYVDAMILRDRDADASSGNGLEERIYVLHDANYNVTALVDTSGNVLERYYYEAYGRAVYLDDAFALLPDGQSDHGWQHLHQGGRLDTITSNYHFRHRDLSPTLGRWISQDPIGFEAGDANLYRYVGNGPGNRLDSLGTDWIPNASIEDSNSGQLAMILPGNPSGLPSDWVFDPSHRHPFGERFRHPSGDWLDFHRGQPGKPKFRGKDHWHHNGGKDHLLPGEEIPDPVTFGPITIPVEAETMQEAATGIGIGVVVYWIVSEVTRLFPPRNLIPIP